MATDSFAEEHTTLDDDITNLKRRVKQLRSDIKTHVSTLLSAYSTGDLPPDLADAIEAQQAHAQESLWRIGAGVTAFRVQDPDPRAVGNGSVLGIRFEIMRTGRFLQPYVVLLNRPYGNESSSEDAESAIARTYLRVHRHTIPSCIPLGGLAGRYLPPPRLSQGPGDEDAPAKRRTQDLTLFVRELRQRLVAYHNRLAAVADMRKAAGLGADEQKRKRRRKQIAATEDDGSALEPSEEDGAEEDDSDNNGTPRIVDIGLADAEAKQVKIDWSNGDVCRLLIDDGGEVEKCVMYGAQGQDTPAAREFLQRITRVEKLPATIRRKRRLNLS